MHGARCKYWTQSRQKIAIWAPLHNFVGLYLCNYKACIANRVLAALLHGKKLLSSNMFTCLHNMVNFGPLAAEIGPVVWHPS